MIDYRLSIMFPLGLTFYIIGGAFIGIAVAFVYVLTGIHATQSTFFTSTLSYFTKLPYFQRESNLKSREWRLFFALGVLLGAIVYTLTISPDGIWVTSVPLWRLIFGGFLVGFGTRLSSGCTSGHGISGVASLSTTSIYAVLTFIATGMITVYILEVLGL
jgi:uncharacterized membrane protein YedE/YeeE